MYCLCWTWMFGLDLCAWQVTLLPCALSCRGFPKKANRTARIASDEEIQGTKDAVIQDLERKLRFKEDLLNNGQPVRRDGFGAWTWTLAAHIREHFLHFGSCTLSTKLISLPLNLSVLLSMMAWIWGKGRKWKGFHYFLPVMKTILGGKRASWR